MQKAEHCAISWTQSVQNYRKKQHENCSTIAQQLLLKFEPDIAGPIEEHGITWWIQPHINFQVKQVNWTSSNKGAYIKSVLH